MQTVSATLIVIIVIINCYVKWKNLNEISDEKKIKKIMEFKDVKFVAALMKFFYTYYINK